jgi:hypothetical protein
MQHQLTKVYPRLARLSQVRILFQAADQTKKRTRRGALVRQILLQGAVISLGDRSQMY